MNLFKKHLNCVASMTLQNSVKVTRQQGNLAHGSLKFSAFLPQLMPEELFCPLQARSTSGPLTEWRYWGPPGIRQHQALLPFLCNSVFSFMASHKVLFLNMQIYEEYSFTEYLLSDLELQQEHNTGVCFIFVC